MSSEIQRALLLMEVERYDEAAEALRRCLSEDPNDGFAHAQLAYCLNARKKFEPATLHARQAVALVPDADFSHRVLGYVLACRNRFPEALVAANAAIECDPDEAMNYGLRAMIRMHQEQWSDALADTEAALRIDPEDTEALNMRAQCLMRLGRRAEAARSVETSLRRQPDNAATHATHGWTLLENGQPREAMEHFREALRLEPDLDYARRGIVQAMKARHFIYRIFLNYIFWMMRLSPRARWGVVIGGLFFIQMIDVVTEAVPVLAPLGLPLFLAYSVFAIMTWLAQPMFDLLLRTSRFGRLALSRDETRGANLFGLWLLVVIGLLIAAIVTDDVRLMSLTIRAGLLLVPMSAIFRIRDRNGRWIMAAATVGLGLLGLIRSVNIWQANGDLMTNPLGQAASTLFILGFIGSQFLANYLMIRTVRR